MKYIPVVVIDLVLVAANLPGVLHGNGISIAAFGFCCAAAGWCAAFGVASNY